MAAPSVRERSLKTRSTISKPPRPYRPSVPFGVYGMVSNHNKPLAKLTLDHTHVHASVHDFVAQITLEQTYTNTSWSAIKDTKYTFPMYHGVTVNKLVAQIGDRVLEAKVKEKEEAKAEYKAAISSGKKAVLMRESEDSPDVFEMNIGMLGKKEKAVVTVTYAVPVKTVDEDLLLTIPMAILGRWKEDPSVARRARTPRGGPSLTVIPSHNSWSVNIEVQLATALESITSPTHEIVVGPGATPNARNVKYSHKGKSELESDFVVCMREEEPHLPRVWIEEGVMDKESPALAATVAAALASEPVSPTIPRATTAVMASLFPDLGNLDCDNDAACEFIFIMDQSGSMRGARMDGAKRALQLCLRSLPEGALFNIVSFGNNHNLMFPKSVPLTEDTLNTASAAVSKFTANYGGTNILGPLRDIFDTRTVENIPRQVFVYTDGLVRNTRQVVRCVRDNIERTGARLFTFGIGKGVSHALVEGMAEAGNGSCEIVDEGVAIEPQVMRQLSRALLPILTNVSIDWGALTPHISTGAPETPAPVFEGARALLFGILKPGATDALDGATVTLKADGPDGPLQWPVKIKLKPALADAVSRHSTGNLVHTMAARARIFDLEKKDDAPSRAEATRMAIKHNVSSKYTSFIAVDTKSHRASGADIDLVEFGADYGVDPIRRGTTGSSGGSAEALPKGRRRRVMSAKPYKAETALRSSDDRSLSARARQSAGPVPTARALRGMGGGGRGGGRGAARTAKVSTRSSTTLPTRDMFAMTRSVDESFDRARSLQSSDEDDADAGGAFAMFGAPAPSAAPSAALSAALSAPGAAMMPTDSLASALEGSYGGGGGAAKYDALFMDDTIPKVKKSKELESRSRQVYPFAVAAPRPTRESRETPRATSKADALNSMLMAQAASGQWNTDGVVVAALSNSVPSHSPPADTDPKFWYTALAIAILEHFYDADSPLWFAMARKAKRWLRSNMGSKDAVAALLAAAKARLSVV